MKVQPKSPLVQLNLPLGEPAALALPPGKHQQLMQALIELLLGSTQLPPQRKGEPHEPQADR